MAYREHVPTRELRPHVACFWTREGTARPHRVLPDGCIDLLLDLGAPPRTGMIVGPMTRALVVPASEGSAWLGVRLRPGAAAAILGHAELAPLDGQRPLEEADGLLRRLEERVRNETGLSAQLKAFEAMLRESLRQHAGPDARVAQVVRAIEREPGATRVDALAAAANLTERQLERLFAQHVGLPPKRLIRTLRLQAVARALDGSAPTAELAYRFGYADQAHLVREFRALAGVTPGAFLRERAMSDSFNPSRADATSFSGEP